MEISDFYADTWKDLSNILDIDLVQDYIHMLLYENIAPCKMGMTFL